MFTQSTGVSSADQARFHNGLSLQGFTGVLNTPNAHITDEGWLYALYTNQEESKWRNRTPYQDNYQFSIGLFNFIELGGRFFEAPRAGRDLSGNFKITTAHLSADKPLLPVLAAGVQDLGGGMALLQTRYLVVSEDLGPLRLSVGYGQGPDRMKGAFGGAELKLHDYFYLLGDYDTAEKNVGARVVFPQFWKVPVSFTATAKTSLSHQPGDFDIAVGLSLPLDLRMKKQQRGVTSSPEARGISFAAAPAPVESRPVGKDLAENLDALRSALIREGFLNVRVGTLERTLVVEYENVTFNHNELDALGVVTGISCRLAPVSFDKLSVVIKRRNIAMTTVTAPLAELRGFLEKPDTAHALSAHLVVDADTGSTAAAVFIAGDDNWGGFNTSLILAPALTTFIGTEVDAFDYYLALKPELSTMLWKGAAATARWNVPVNWSSNLENGREFRSSRQPGQLDRLMLYQAVKPLPSVAVNLGGGMVVADRYGVLNEALWSPGGGAHRFRISQAWAEEETTHLQNELFIGSYRYYYSPLDISIEAAGGKFWAKDKGGTLELKRFWEDTAVSFYYKGSKGQDDKFWQAVGIQFSIPLTPRRDMKPIAKLQVRGADEWSYAQESTLENDNVNNTARGSLNYLAPYPLTINPQPTQASYRSLYNRDRLSDAYIRQHLDRLRDAWLKYGKHEL